MTGYGRGAAVGEKFRATVELRSVNGRFLEIRSKVPRSLSFLEPMLREKLEKQLSRGMIDLSLSLQPLAQKLDSQFDPELAEAYAEKAKELSNKLDLPAGITALSLLKLPGVLGAENVEAWETEKEIPAIVATAVEEALESLLAMRRKEGEKLAKVLHRELEELANHRDWIFKHREELNEKYSKKLKARIQDWMGKENVNFEEGRLQQEVAYYLDRSDVTEEIDRLGSHLKQCEDALSGGKKAVGKRLEFLSQELGREVNTIGSKSDQTNVTNHVLEMKLAIEKIREQVQNLE